MNRREYLKTSAALLAGPTLVGCGEHNPHPSTGSGPAAAAPHARAMYDQGTVPIEESGWTLSHGTQPPHGPLQADIDADVVVVGAGLAGASLALHLAQTGVSVAVLEARQPGWGASGRNAGHVLPLLKDLEVIRRFPDGGRKFLELFREHHSITFELAKAHGIDCDAVQSGYLNAMRRRGAFEDFSDQAAYWEKEQGQEVERLGASEMKKLTGSAYYPYGVLYKAGGRVNPYLFTNGMVSAAVRHGAAVFGDSEALALTRAGNRWRVRVAEGSVLADRVVFCTNAYPTGIVPEFTKCYYPLTAYALSTRPLPPKARELMMPSRMTLAQVPLDLNPFVIDGSDRIITASIPSASKPENAIGHFRNHLTWIHRTWPEAQELDIQLEAYWTGRVALRDREFPGVFEVKPGVFGLMHFNTWGNLMAPLLGLLLADALASDRLDRLPFPVEQPRPVGDQEKQNRMIRKIMIPAARLAQSIGVV